MGGGFWQLRAPGFGSYLLFAGSAGWEVAPEPAAAAAVVQLSASAPAVPAVRIAVDSFRPRQAERAVALTQTTPVPCVCGASSRPPPDTKHAWRPSSAACACSACRSAPAQR